MQIVLNSALTSCISALGRRDLVHRQTASAVVQHMSLGVYGFGCEDSLNHLLNYVWPNVFETSPHVIQAVMGALEGLRVAIGPCRMLQYCLQVRFTSNMESAHLFGIYVIVFPLGYEDLSNGAMVFLPQ